MVPLLTISPKEFRLLADYIKTMYGIHLKEEKTALVLGRLSQILLRKGMKSFTEYYEYVVSDRTGAAAVDLVNRISTNHTFFMREPEHFRYFRDHVLPYLAQTAKDKDLRVWCAGCSTGQESYALAMIMADYFQLQPGAWDTSLLATDISATVLTQAKQGEYAADQVDVLPKPWRDRYFTKSLTGAYTVTDAVKERIVYRKFNLMEPVFPFKKKFQVIFCRNVMIYFDNPTKDRLVNKFWKHTVPGGYLFISQSESLNRETSGYRYIRPGVYRKESGHEV